MTKVDANETIQGALHSRRQWIGAAAALSLGCFVEDGAAQQAWPVRPITLLVPVPAGGAMDALARSMATFVAARLGQSVVVENRAGASATLAASALAQANSADGYTLGLAPATVFKLPHLQKLTYDPMRDLTYIMAFTSFTYALLVPKNSPWSTIQEFVSYARANPGKVSIGATGTGSSGHIAISAFMKSAGIDGTFVPFKGGAEVLQAFLGGHISAILDAGWTPAERSGGRPLLTFTEKRIARLPEVPTAAEAGFNVVIRSPVGIIGPRGMDPKVATIVHDAFRAALASPAYRQILEANDLVDGYLGGVEYAQLARTLFAEEKENLKNLGITGQ